MDDCAELNLRKRPRGTWSLAERLEYYREMRWQRCMRIAERLAWAALAMFAAAFELPMPWHGG